MKIMQFEKLYMKKLKIKSKNIKSVKTNKIWKREKKTNQKKSYSLKLLLKPFFDLVFCQISISKTCSLLATNMVQNSLHILQRMLPNKWQQKGSWIHFSSIILHSFFFFALQENINKFKFKNKVNLMNNVHYRNKSTGENIYLPK